MDEEQATTNEVILHEVLYILTSPRQYGLSHEEAVARLRPLVAMHGLRLPAKQRYLHALDLYSTYSFLDFGDALAIAQTEDQRIDAIYSYDTDFDDVPGARRIEP